MITSDVKKKKLRKETLTEAKGRAVVFSDNCWSSTVLFSTDKSLDMSKSSQLRFLLSKSSYLYVMLVAFKPVPFIYLLWKENRLHVVWVSNIFAVFFFSKYNLYFTSLQKSVMRSSCLTSYVLVENNVSAWSRIVYSEKWLKYTVVK